MKLGVIGGAGVLGSAGAFLIALNGIVDEIILYDVRSDWAKNHAMDIDQGVCESVLTKTRAADRLGELSVCDAILNAAGTAEGNATSRDAYLDGNLKIYADIAREIGAWEATPIVLSASNPIDVLNHKLCGLSGGAAKNFIGYSKNDTVRFKWAVSLETGVPASQIDALTIGEHGAYQVPLYSTLRHSATGEAIFLDAGQRSRVQAHIDGWFGMMSSLGVPRTMGWTSAVGMCNVIEAICSDSGAQIPCSVIPNGEYGLSGLSIGLPVRLGRSGVREIVELPLSDEEHEGLAKAAAKIKSLL